jgi:aminocarboxymuconate-semialdehyde decarboxylase
MSVTEKARAKIALDVHAHLIPVRRLWDAPGVGWDAPSRQLHVDGKAIALKPLFDPAALVAWMDDNGVEQAWISIPPPAYRQSLDEVASQDWTDRINEGLKEIALEHPGRLEPLYHLPLEHPRLAAEIAKRLNATRYALCAGGETTLIFSDARLEELWGFLDAQKAFVFLHPGRCCDPRLSEFYLENLIGNPHETAIAVAHLVFGGILQRFSSIRFCLAHGGGTVPMIAGRWQRGFESGQPGVNTQLQSPGALLPRLYAECITHSEAALGCSAAVFGEDRLLFGSDWPFLMGLPEPANFISRLPQSLRDRICRARPR